MSSLKSCWNRNVQDPWSIQTRLYLDRLHYNPEAFAREGMDEAARSKLRTEYDQNKDKGNKSFDIADHTFNPEAQKKKTFLSRALRRLQAKTGINEEKYLAQVEEATSMKELVELEVKFKECGIKYYKQQMEKSCLFIEMHPGEREFIRNEKAVYFGWIEKQPLDAEDDEESSITEALSHLKEHLAERREGRERLKGQSSYVKKEYFRRLGSMAVDGSKEKLLEDVLKRIGNLEKEPSAIQAEFKKASKAAAGSKDTATILKGIREEYEKRVGEYNGILAEHQAYFGGKEVNTPKGKRRAALQEFEDWFADLHKFSEMQEKRDRLLDTVIPGRMRVYKKRDEMLAALPEKKRELIRRKTDEMRLHTLKTYLDESKAKNLRESVFAMEYMAELETAEYDGYPLFSSPEKAELKRIIQTSNAELQEAELKVLVGRMIPEREKEAADYLALGKHLRDDHRFFTANIYERRRMIRDAKEKESRELRNPFDIDNLQALTREERMSLLLTKLGSTEGERTVQTTRRGLAQEGKTQRTDTQMKVMGVMSGQWRRMKTDGTTQPENYMNAIYEGARVENEGLWRGAWESGVAKNEKQKYMAETARTDYRAYLSDRARTWGGRTVRVGKVNKQEFVEGKKTIFEKLEQAGGWGENMLFLNAQGEDDLRPAETAAEVMEDSLRAELIMMLEALGLRMEEVPSDFKEALIRLAIVGENAGIFSRMNQLTGGGDIVEDAVN
ncbi:MAG: hypothetical protein WC653_03705 [Candidatus Gracilibacteria bacterium]